MADHIKKGVLPNTLFNFILSKKKNKKQAAFPE
jgi:hypothetical protein